MSFLHLNEGTRRNKQVEVCVFVNDALRYESYAFLNINPLSSFQILSNWQHNAVITYINPTLGLFRGILFCLVSDRYQDISLDDWIAESDIDIGGNKFRMAWCHESLYYSQPNLLLMCKSKVLTNMRQSWWMDVREANLSLQKTEDISTLICFNLCKS